jgi:DNA-binding SARP family transcriptional activator
MDTIQLLGQTQATLGGRRVAGRGFGGTKIRQVLEILALAPGRPVAKDQLAELIWDGAPPRSWVTTLEAYVSQLRRVLAPGVPVRGSVVVTTSGAYHLDDERVRVDLAAFADEVRRCAGLPATSALPALQAALDAANGIALQDEPYASWAIEARESHERLVVKASVQAGELALARGLAPAASGHGLRATAVDPLDERGWRLRMQAAWAEGDRRAAQQAYRECRDRLRTELGVAPAPVTQQLHERLQGRADGDLVDHLLGRLVDVLLDEGGHSAADPRGPLLDPRTVLDTNALAARIARAVHERTCRIGALAALSPAG